MGALDATQHPGIAQEYGVNGYPTIKFFAAGSGEPEEYDGGRTADSIVRWGEEKFAENVPPPEMIQITSEDTVKEGCGEHPLCVIAFLPHILDCQVSGQWGENMDKVRRILNIFFWSVGVP